MRLAEHGVEVADLDPVGLAHVQAGSSWVAIVREHLAKPAPKVMPLGHLADLEVWGSLVSRVEPEGDELQGVIEGLDHLGGADGLELVKAGHGAVEGQEATGLVSVTRGEALDPEAEAEPLGLE